MAVTASDVVNRVNPHQTATASGFALKIHLVYVCQEGSHEQVILDVQLSLGLLELLEQLNRSQLVMRLSPTASVDVTCRSVFVFPWSFLRTIEWDTSSRQYDVVF